jgi:hypothetical protein
MPKDGLGQRCVPKCSAIVLESGYLDTATRRNDLPEALEHLQSLVIDLGRGFRAGAVAGIPSAAFTTILPSGQDHRGGDGLATERNLPRVHRAHRGDQVGAIHGDIQGSVEPGDAMGRFRQDRKVLVPAVRVPQMLAGGAGARDTSKAGALIDLYRAAALRRRVERVTAGLSAEREKPRGKQQAVDVRIRAIGGRERDVQAIRDDERPRAWRRGHRQSLADRQYVLER